MLLYIIRVIALFIGYFALSLIAICGLLFLAFLVKGLRAYLRDGEGGNKAD